MSNEPTQPTKEELEQLPTADDIIVVKDNTKEAE